MGAAGIEWWYKFIKIKRMGEDFGDNNRFSYPYTN
jgi:hypothetical protein